MDEQSVPTPEWMEHFRVTKTSGKELMTPFLFFSIIAIITIVVAAVLYTWALTFIRSDKQYPKVTAECYQTTEGDYAIEVIEVDPDAVCALQVNYKIVDENGDVLSGEERSARFIYGVDLAFQGSSSFPNTEDHEGNVSFMDMDVDGKISAGDHFTVRSVGNGGIAWVGYEFILKFDVTGDRMAKVAFDDQRLWNGTSERSVMQTVTLDSTNISVQNGTSVMDRIRYYIMGEGFYSFSFTYLGGGGYEGENDNGNEEEEGERNITFSMILNGEMIQNDSMSVKTNDFVSLHGNFTYEASYFDGFAERLNMSVRVSDIESNVTLFYGIREYSVVGSGCGCPSFLLPPPLQVVTVVIIVGLYYWKTRKRF